MKTTPRPNQSDDLQLDSSVLVSSTWEPDALNLDNTTNEERSVPQEPSDTDRWAATPSKWGVATGRGQSADWEKDACLEFRVRCEGQPTRRLRLSGARYTLGCGVGCSIRLDDPSLRPLHAVLIRDQARVLVRAYSVPFQINDARVTEGTLELHDRLRLGAYEFELLEHTPLPEQVTKPKKSSPPPELVSSKNRSVEMDEWERSFHEEAKHWRALKQDVERRDQWCRSREQEVLEQREWLEQQIELLKKRQDELTSQESAAIEVHDEFSEQFDELKQRQKEIELQQKELDAGREHLRLQQERLDGRDRLHRLQIEKLLSEQESFRDRHAEQESIIADAENQVRSSQERADAANAAVEQMRLKFASLNEQLLELTDQQESLQRLEADRNREHQLRCDDLAMSRDEALAQRDDAARQRDEAIDAKANSDARREKTLLRCDELETIEEQLRVEINQLQDEIATTRNEASQLDEQCKSARETIAQLEGTIETNEQRHESDRESWTQEVELLRKNLDDLTFELAGAQSQLTRLREDNDRLAEQLAGAHQDRDDARQKQEAATRECEAANIACEEAKAEIVAARRQLAEALTHCDDARQDREELQSLRDQVNGELKTTQADREDWERRAEQAEQRYAEAQDSLAEARDQWQKAEHARDDAETQRLAAEQKLVEARRDLEAMQIERDNAVSDSDDLRRQRDKALEDANQTRQLYDRSNRDHDDTLDRIEFLERQTREVISDKKKSPPSQLASADAGPALGLVGVEAIADLGNNTDDEQAEATPSLSEPVVPLQEEALTAQPADLSAELSATEQPAEDPNEDVWPTYSVASDTASSEVDDSYEPQAAEEPQAIAWNVSPADMPPIPTSPSAFEDITASVEPATAPEEVSGVYEITDDASSESLSLPQWPTAEEPVSDEAADLSELAASVELPESTELPGSADLPELANTEEPLATESSVAETPRIPVWPEATASHLLPKEQIGSEETGDVADPVEAIQPESPLGSPQAEPEFSYNEFNYDNSPSETPQAAVAFEHDASDDVSVGMSDSMHGADYATDDEAPLASGFESEAEIEAEAEESIGAQLLREMGIEQKAIEDSVDEDCEKDHSEPVAVNADNTEEPEVVPNSWIEEQPPEADLPAQAEAVSEDLGQTAMVSEPMLSQLEQLEASYNDSPEEESVNMTAQWQPGAMLDSSPMSQPEDMMGPGLMAEPTEGSVLSDFGATNEEPGEQSVNALMSSTDTPEAGNLFSEPERVEATEEPYMGLDSQDAVEPSSDDPPADDDSIEAYMNRLLQRVQGQAESDGGAPAKPTASSAASKPKPTPSEAKNASTSSGNIDTSHGVDEGLDETVSQLAEANSNAPLVPRSQAPERNSNLSAMRELANESARSAINRSQKSQSHTTRIQAMLKFVYAGVALVCGLVAVAMIDLVLLRCIAVLAALIVAGIFVKEGFTLMTGLAGRDNSREATAQVAEGEDAE